MEWQLSLLRLGQNAQEGREFAAAAKQASQQPEGIAFAVEQERQVRRRRGPEEELRVALRKEGSSVGVKKRKKRKPGGSREGEEDEEGKESNLDVYA